MEAKTQKQGASKCHTLHTCDCAIIRYQSVPPSAASRLSPLAPWCESTLQERDEDPAFWYRILYYPVVASPSGTHPSYSQPSSIELMGLDVVNAAGNRKTPIETHRFPGSECFRWDEKFGGPPISRAFVPRNLAPISPPPACTCLPSIRGPATTRLSAPGYITEAVAHSGVRVRELLSGSSPSLAANPSIHRSALPRSSVASAIGSHCQA